MLMKQTVNIDIRMMSYSKQNLKIGYPTDYILSDNIVATVLCLKGTVATKNEKKATAHQLNPCQIVTKIDSGNIGKQCQRRNIAWNKIFPPCLGKEIMQTSGRPGVI